MRLAPIGRFRSLPFARRGASLISVLFLLSFVLFVLSGCGLGARAATPSTGHATTGQAMAVTVPAQQGGAPSQAVRAVGAPVAGAAAAIGAPVVNQSVPLPSLPSDQMLIRTGQIELEAKDPSALVDQVRQIAASASAGSDVGYVADERLQSNDGAYTATITINVPASTFATIMQALRGLGSRVVNETSSSQDVTEQFVDVDAQLQALHATQAQLMQLLGKTQQVSDTLSVQRELSNVDSQINQLEGRENYLKAHSAFSTIAVTIHPPATATTASTALWNPLHSLLSAIAVLGAVAQGAVDAAIWLLVFGVPLAAVALIGLAIQRGVARTLRARRAPTT